MIQALQKSPVLLGALRETFKSKARLTSPPGDALARYAKELAQRVPSSGRSRPAVGLSSVLARHECETRVCRQKGIEFARRLLGHANISTTQRYMHLDDQELADAQDLVE
jgi:site-specific recombinase XerC